MPRPYKIKEKKKKEATLLPKKKERKKETIGQSACANGHGHFFQLRKNASYKYRILFTLDLHAEP